MEEDIIAALSKTLGSYRAENLGDRMFSLYTAPTYFPQLLTPIPCMLRGGRGTGKTTVLKCLSYEGQFRLCKENFESFNKINYIGLYYKLETGLVSAFSGAKKDDEFWQPIFSHFINLQLCKQLCDFALWFQEKKGSLLRINKHQLQTFCLSIGMEDVNDLTSLNKRLDIAISKLEFFVNYASDPIETQTSPIGSPPRRFIKLLKNTNELKSKIFYFLFDEYENLREYQQAVLNTFIKQADSELTFKIGVRELGLKTRHTLNTNEQLVDPADYVLIDVSHSLGDEDFDQFAKQVFKHRFEELRKEGIQITLEVDNLFENLTEDQEAVNLGAEEIADEIRTIISKCAHENELLFLKNFTIRDFVIIKFISGEKSSDIKIYDCFKRAINNPIWWRNKINNYSYASLFSIRKRKVGIVKYYSGWKTLLSLSAGNIRYLLQLVTNSLINHAKDNKDIAQKISSKCQTLVAAEVGKKNLLELEGLSTRGAQLMKLVLGLGQVLHEMAVQGQGHVPELTQFEISYKDPDDEIMTQVNELVQAAVMHLALIRTSGTKLGGPGDTRDFDYMLHPIFAPFFVYSHRSKRKFTITPEELFGLITTHSITIKGLLEKQHRVASGDIPEQLRLFGGYYEGNS